MLLPGIFFTGDVDSRIIVVDDDTDNSHAVINGTLVTSRELDEIQSWCLDRECVLYRGGIVSFTNSARLYEFVLTWG